ncbi:MupA/Atu3671 family FMN-dependent luciferase-like monooxygenase [Tabrizicola soli]|uniref:MupA/Atu3671 family FMN-dependent luciferase-like monooxygenase n=1 Tax=Tabrizicola soli TaxID=2185115 RepID=A0ABV7DSC4_9RHOB|nr:MupA/Atu3671 family FMN-dependent luciferase-like monooxygenase [Tabrizicola soli]
MEFGLFFFANDTSEAGQSGKYDLIFDAARWADANGMARLWIPERHFHSFGGLSPNPSVLAAALAGVTRRIQICAGSVVLPLHDPIRVAEEWSIVDNVSGGRVGLGIASGWVPNDFVISGHQEDFGNRKQVFRDKTEILRRLWRGEPHKVRNPLGEEVDLRIMPRPVQPDLPIWITAAANPETFREAGTIGAHVLTHLLGQTVEDLAAKIVQYREAWDAAGHEGRGTVTLMLHTLVGDDDDEVHDLARAPMMTYLGASFDLASRHLASVPFLRDPGRIEVSQLTPELAEAALEASFEKYFYMGSLLGSYDKCLATVDKLAQLDVDEVACLVDFGLAPQIVLKGLENLNVLRKLANPEPLRAA